jgi:hypothetical protein
MRDSGGNDLVELRRSLGELRIAYHQALARRTGREIPTNSQVRRAINSVSGDDRVVTILQQQHGSLLRTGVVQLQRLLSRIALWR